MLEPKTKIFIAKSPGRFPSVVALCARKYGVHGWSAIHFQRAGSAPLHRDEDAAAVASSQPRCLLLDSLRLDGIGFPGRSTGSRRAGFRKPGPQTREWLEYRPDRWHIRAAEYAR